ncbi:amino acid transporter, partial [Aureobasidium melanogenum]
MSSQTNSSHDEHISFSKVEKQPLDLPQYGEEIIAETQLGESREVFQAHVDGVEFRNVSWQRATVVFVKINFAMSILSIPAAMAALGSVGGSLSLVGFTALNMYTALVLGDYRLKHTQCHMLADMMGNIWGRVGRELVGVQIIVAQVLISAGGIVTTATAFNALSDHGACTAIFSLVSAILITLCSSIRTFSRLGWLTWFGFLTFFLAVFIFTVAVTQQDRPAAAPKTGAFELGWTAIAYPSFVVGMINASNIFVSTSGSSMFLPVISEMRRPQDYRKACLWAGLIVGAMYLTFSLVIYRWCGSWLSTPAFGSAGPLFKKISYGISLPGLIIGVGIYQHVAAKYAFVRLLRDSKHLQAKTIVHWSTWLGINLALGTVAYIVAEAVPILNYLLALASALCFAPFSLVFPALLWLNDYRSLRSGTAAQKLKYGLHALIVVLGAFMVVGGTYAVGVSIKEAFADGLIARVFDCRDDSGSGN